ncbi:uncharacterized protein LOC134222996 [Armigeres subalbatus]|uniref:uncharacterized protein LOC134222996 n=1 Tax=Armigeres subalbatus TaxID=124917 RepID=UPI002ECFE4EE
MIDGFSSAPGRTLASTLKEVPIPLIVVAPFPPAASSRPGPTLEMGDGIFRTPSTAKFQSLHSVNKILQNDVRVPGRTSATSIEEAPNPLNTVVPFLPTIISRPGPVFEIGNGGFRTPLSGNEAMDDSTLPSELPFNYTSRIQIINRSPGCTPASSMEALNPLIAVEPLQPALRSHPGPVIESGTEGFQTVIAGKYNIVQNNSLPVTYVTSSIQPVDADSNPEQPAISSNVSNNCLPVRGSISSGELPAHALRIYYQNVRGLRTKVDSFFLAASECDYDVIVLTETWLDEHILGIQLFGPKFAVYRTDRNSANSTKSRGGGVLIAVSTRWNSYVDSTLTSIALEQLWIRISTADRLVSIGVLYLPPDRRSDINCIRDHMNSFSSISSNLDFNDFVLQLGDYNQPNLEWVASEDGFMHVNPQSVLSTSSSALVDGFSFNCLTQLNGVANRNGRFLDLVLANDAAKSTCTVSEAIEPLIYLDADHPALDIVVNLPGLFTFDDASDVHQMYDYRRADYDSICDAISCIDWSPIEIDVCVDDAVNYFTRQIHRIIAEHVPLCRPKPKPPWSNSRLRQLKRSRAKALRQYCKNRTLITKQEFNRSSTAYRVYNRFLYRRYVLRTQSSLRRNPKRFWSFVNSKRKEVGLPSCLHLGEEIASSELEKCNLFVRHFLSTFNATRATADQIAVANQFTPRNVLDLHAFIIDEQTVLSAIRKLKSSYTAGPDGIPSSVLKNCSNSLATHLARIFTLSLQEGEFPDEWKMSHMFPECTKLPRHHILMFLLQTIRDNHE